MHSATEWNLKFDLDGMLVAPLFFASVPDILLFSVSSKKVIIIILTCPCEEDMSQWHEEKSQKYYPLCCSIRSNVWYVYFYHIEVGAGVFVLNQSEVGVVAQASITNSAGKPCRSFPVYH